MQKFISTIKKPFEKVAKFFISIDWANVKVQVWVRYILMVVSIVNTILTHYGKNPLPISEDGLYQVLSDAITTVIFIVNTYKDNPTSKEAIASDQIQKAMKASKDLNEIREVLQSKLDEVDAEIEEEAAKAEYEEDI